MNNTINEYNKRLQEIELYFSTLSLLDEGTCTISCVDILNREKKLEIDEELSKILKANGFILLYNLIEATIRNSIEAIISALNSSNVTFRELTDDLRKLWINQEFKTLDKDDILNLSKKILENEMLSLQSECIKISGNVDARKIREIAERFGCEQVPNGEGLVTIKDKRNKLAHGEFTFTEIGKNYTVNDIIQLKEETKSYLSQVLTKTQNYIANQNFKNNP